MHLKSLFAIYFLVLYSEAFGISLGIVKCDNFLNVRTEPNLTANIRSKLSGGTTCILYDSTNFTSKIGEKESKWYCISNGGFSWIFGGFIKHKEWSEYDDFENLKATILDYFPDKEFIIQLNLQMEKCKRNDWLYIQMPPYVSLDDSLKTFKEINVCNIDADSSLELIVKYSCNFRKLFNTGNIHFPKITSQLFVLDKNGEKYNRLPLGTAGYFGYDYLDNSPSFYKATDLVESNLKELIVIVTCGDESQCNDLLQIWKPEADGFIQCGSIFLGNYEGGDNQFTIEFVSTDADSELEIIATTMDLEFISTTSYDYDGSVYQVKSSDLK